MLIAVPSAFSDEGGKGDWLVGLLSFGAPGSTFPAVAVSEPIVQLTFQAAPFFSSDFRSFGATPLGWEGFAFIGLQKGADEF